MESKAIQGEWEESLRKSESTLDSVDSALLHEGPSFEVETKKGGKLNINTQFYYFDGIEFTPSTTLKSGIRLYIFARNQKGEVVGTRIASISNVNKKTLHCKSKIIVRDKGQGLASPIEEVFLHTLQYIADKEKKTIIWKIQNKNLEKIEAYKRSDTIDPERLATLEAEQARWQYLYGEGGKFGISNNRRIFTPSEDTTKIIGGSQSGFQERVESAMNHYTI